MSDQPAADRLPCRVTVCRDCCCGTPKIPGADHAGQIVRLREQGVPVRVSLGLGVCEQADVVVVQPSADGRAAGGRPVRLGLVNDQDAEADIAAWAHAGGPGVAPVPDVLSLYLIAPPGPLASSPGRTAAARCARR